MSGDSDLDIKDDDIIHVVGTVKDKYDDAENALGGSASVPKSLPIPLKKATMQQLLPQLKKQLTWIKHRTSTDLHSHFKKLNLLKKKLACI
ncbi:hypothetical protein ACSQ7W_17770 [Bacillus halotolerans]|uniref:hypothetical protein n=1 Tax=Bacillus halotolerans TaxID=260554 RepID=UPI002158A51F|nr:hypothetical protein [Bacillus halotolerans]